MASLECWLGSQASWHARLAIIGRFLSMG